MRAKFGHLGSRAYLVKLLHECEGLSRRKALAVVNALLESIIKALGEGKRVQFPFGYLHREGNTIFYRMSRSGERELKRLRAVGKAPFSPQSGQTKVVNK